MKKIVLLVLIGFLLFAAVKFVFGLGKGNQNNRNVATTSFATEESPIIIAHRGASGYAPEHTYSSYNKAIEMGADYLEIDLRMTKDGKLVSMHDSTVDRTTNGHGEVKDLTLAEIKTFDAGKWFNQKYSSEKVLTLEEILSKYKDKEKYYIETRPVGKQLKMEKQLVDLLHQYDLVRKKKVIVQSFSEASLKKVHKLDKNIPLTQLIKNQKVTNEDIKKWKQYATYIGMDANLVDQDLLKKLHLHGLKMHVFFLETAKEKSEQVRVIKLGVDGIFTNYPDYSIEVSLMKNKL